MNPTITPDMLLHNNPNAPKSLDDIHPFCASERAELISGTDGQVRGGLPGELPTQIPFVFIARMAATLKQMEALLKEVQASQIAMIGTDHAQHSALLSSLANKARDLLEISPPPEPPLVAPVPANNPIIIGGE